MDAPKFFLDHLSAFEDHVDSHSSAEEDNLGEFGGLEGLLAFLDLGEDVILRTDADHLGLRGHRVGLILVCVHSESTDLIFLLLNYKNSNAYL